MSACFPPERLHLFDDLSLVIGINREWIEVVRVLRAATAGRRTSR
jgi:hypothetical protein